MCITFPREPAALCHCLGLCWRLLVCIVVFELGNMALGKYKLQHKSSKCTYSCMSAFYWLAFHVTNLSETCLLRYKWTCNILFHNCFERSKLPSHNSPSPIFENSSITVKPTIESPVFASPARHSPSHDGKKKLSSEGPLARLIGTHRGTADYYCSWTASRLSKYSALIPCFNAVLTQVKGWNLVIYEDFSTPKVRSEVDRRGECVRIHCSTNSEGNEGNIKHQAQKRISKSKFRVNVLCTETNIRCWYMKECGCP